MWGGRRVWQSINQCLSFDVFFANIQNYNYYLSFRTCSAFVYRFEIFSNVVIEIECRDCGVEKVIRKSSVNINKWVQFNLIWVRWFCIAWWSTSSSIVGFCLFVWCITTKWIKHYKPRIHQALLPLQCIFLFTIQYIQYNVSNIPIIIFVCIS